MRAKLVDCVVMAAQLLFVGRQIVNGAVTIATNRDGGVHLLPCEVLLEPLVPMARARNQVMLSRSTFRQAATQFTALDTVGFHRQTHTVVLRSAATVQPSRTLSMFNGE